MMMMPAAAYFTAERRFGIWKRERVVKQKQKWKKGSKGLKKLAQQQQLIMIADDVPQKQPIDKNPSYYQGYVVAQNCSSWPVAATVNWLLVLVISCL